MSGIIGIVHRVNMSIWVIKTDWVWFLVYDKRFYPEEELRWMYQCFCWSLWFVIPFYVCSEGYVLWMTFYLLTMVLWRDKSIVFHHIVLKFSNTFVAESTSKSVLFKVWNWWGPWSLIWSRLILFTSIFVDVLTLIWSIMVLKFIAVILFDSVFNHGIFCLNVWLIPYFGGRWLDTDPVFSILALLRYYYQHMYW